MIFIAIIREEASDFDDSFADEIVNYIEQGGKLFLSGGDLIWNGMQENLTQTLQIENAGTDADNNGFVHSASTHSLLNTPYEISSNIEYGYSYYGDGDKYHSINEKQ